MVFKIVYSCFSRDQRFESWVPPEPNLNNTHFPCKVWPRSLLILYDSTNYAKL
jgi:hypothetical protein